MLTPDDLGALVRAVAVREADFQDIVALLQPLLLSDEGVTNELALALSTALHELEDIADVRDAQRRLADQYAAPALIVDATGQVIAVNHPMHEQAVVEPGCTLRELGVSEAEFAAFKERLVAPGTSTLLTLVRLRTLTEDHDRPMVVVGHHDAAQNAYVLVALQQHWPASIEHAVMSLFDLSRREAEVLAGLAAGLTADDIAHRHQRKVTTIRQQTKSLLKKMGVSTQMQAATMAAAASNAVNRHVALAPQTLNLPTQREPWFTGEIERKGRRIGWRRFGRPGGKPLLLVHGPSFGAGEFEHDRYWAKQFDLDVIAVERPGYGRTDRPHRKDDPLQCQVADINAVLASIGVQPEQVLAHEVGLVIGLAWAAGHAASVKSVLGVSCAPPFATVTQLSTMPEQQGIFILAARRAPWLAKLLLRLLVVRLRQLGPERWYQAVFPEGSYDLMVTQREAFQQGVLATYPFYTQQLGAGFEVDLQVMIQDWGHWVTECPVPITLLHGQDNPSTPLEYLSVFKALNSAVEIQCIEKSGLTLALSEPERIYRELARK